MQRITEFEGGRFQPTYAEVRRFRCNGCGATGSVETPDTETGFRLSKTAADEIVGTSIASGMKRAGETAGIDVASVSRLVAARADRLLENRTRPRIARAESLDSGVVAISDALTGDITVCFSGGGDPRLLPWLSRPYPSVVVPAAELMAHALRWTGLKVSIASDTALSVLSPLVEKARQRLTSAYRGLDGGPADSSAPARHFLRSSERLYAAMEAPDIGTAKAAITKWIGDCTGFWADVFAPVLRFLSTYQDCLFNHGICLEPVPPRRLEFSGPANLMTLAFNRRPQLTPHDPLVLRPSGLAF
jgi:hypothetical protein